MDIVPFTPLNNPFSVGSYRGAYNFYQRLRDSRRGPGSLASNERMARSYEDTMSRGSRRSSKRRKTWSMPSKKSLTTAYGGGGAFAGKFRNKKVKGDKIRFGVAQRTENVGEIVCTDEKGPVYIAHTPFSGDTIGPVFCLAIFRKMAKKHGYDIKGGDILVKETIVLPVGSIEDLHFSWSRTVGSNPEVFTNGLSFSHNDTWMELAEQWWADIKSAVNVQNLNISFQTIALLNQDSVSNKSALYWRLDLRDCFVRYDFVSTLKLQNRTGGNNDASTSTTDVEANPLQGRQYDLGVNQVLLKQASVVPTVGLPTFKMDAVTGMVEIPYFDIDYDAQMSATLLRPPNSSAFRYCKGFSNIYLAPGQIKYGKAKRSGSMNLDKFWELVLYGMAGTATSENALQFGCAQLFGLEKMMRTDTGTAKVTVGFEHNQYHKVQIGIKQNAGMVRLTNVIP